MFYIRLFLLCLSDVRVYLNTEIGSGHSEHVNIRHELMDSWLSSCDRITQDGC